MKKYLIALDLDGTLLSDWQTISETTINYLLELKKQGHTLVIATGRPFRSSEKFYNELELNTPIINYNGGLVTNKYDPTFIPYSLTVKKEYVIDIFEKNRIAIKNAFGEIDDDIYLYEDTEDVRPLIHFFNGAKLFVGDFNETLTGDTNGFLIIAKDNEAEIIEEYVKNHYQGKVLARNWGHHYNFIIELYTPETNKGAGLKYVAESLGFKKEDVIAFGDAHNDIEMLQCAGTGVAMINSQEVLKEHADYITKYSNTEDGIVHFLKEFLKN